MGDFSITYTLDSESWQEVAAAFRRHGPASDYDRLGLPTYDLLNAAFVISHEGEVIHDDLVSLEATGVPRSGQDGVAPLLEIASQLDHFLERLVYPTSIATDDESVDILFSKTDGQVELTDRHFGITRVDEPVLLGGIRDFLGRAASDVRKFAPESLSWESFGFLRRWLVEDR